MYQHFPILLFLISIGKKLIVVEYPDLSIN
jgi:hypothetical protein